MRYIPGFATAALLTAGLLALSPTASAAKHYGGELCAYPEFDCVKVQRGDTWKKLFPNKKERDMVKRLNRMSASVRNRPWIVVPKKLDDLEYLSLSPFPHQLEEPINRERIVVDLSDQAFAAYNAEGELVHWGPISGGKDYCPDTGAYCGTVTGKFSITRKQGAKCASSKYPIETGGGAPMPYCMHFYRGYAMHEGSLPGRHASHGCVRLFKDDAAWLNKTFAKIGTPVTIQE